MIHSYMFSVISGDAACPECGGVIAGAHIDLMGKVEKLNRLMQDGRFDVTCDHCGYVSEYRDWKVEGNHGQEVDR